MSIFLTPISFMSVVRVTIDNNEPVTLQGCSVRDCIEAAAAFQGHFSLSNSVQATENKFELIELNLESKPKVIKVRMR